VSDTFQLQRLEEVVRETIPLATAMDIRVLASDEEGLRLGAPLAANANLHGTIFGGSAAALAILAGWALVRLRLLAQALEPTLVIQRTSMDFLAPAEGDLVARAHPPDDEAWDRFVRTFHRHGRARLAVEVTLWADGAQVARLTGWYVALEEDEAA
jgi:thioesterase domain-containing protein